MKAKEIMQRKLITVPPDMLVTELVELFSSRGISGAPVVDLGRPIGVVSMTDVANNAGIQGELIANASRLNYYRDVWMEEEEFDGFTVGEVDSRTVADIMTPAVYQADENSPVEEVVSTMLEARIHRVIVTDKEKAVGIITTTDLIKLIPELLKAVPAAR